MSLECGVSYFAFGAMTLRKFRPMLLRSVVGLAKG
jgi:hypothetical protein